tara:strand:- start:282 stop:494 length:213 start_codon:yes stop_codon:yes gene_type:complete
MFEEDLGTSQQLAQQGHFWSVYTQDPQTTLLLQGLGFTLLKEETARTLTPRIFLQQVVMSQLVFIAHHLL